MMKLTVLSGPDAGSVFAPTTDTIVIGRGHDCDVVLHDSRVSRRHCKIYREERNFIISDLRTTNGVFLNDPKIRINTHVLKNGDEILFGGSRLRVEFSPSLGEGLFPPTSGVTIEDALSAPDPTPSLPSNWQEGMTVFVSRSKLLAEVAKPAMGTENTPQARDSFLARIRTRVKRLLAAVKFSPVNQSPS